jgi:hypothetical protein
VPLVSARSGTEVKPTIIPFAPQIADQPGHAQGTRNSASGRLIPQRRIRTNHSPSDTGRRMRAFLKEALERKGALSAQATEATWWGSRCEGIPTAGIPGHAYIGSVGHKRPYKDVGDTTGVAKCGSDIGYWVPL